MRSLEMMKGMGIRIDVQLVARFKRLQCRLLLCPGYRYVFVDRERPQLDPEYCVMLCRSHHGPELVAVSGPGLFRDGVFL